MNEKRETKTKLAGGENSHRPTTDLTDPTLYINREWSALEFQRKVLARAADESIPLLERLGALTVFFHNLDEFFMVRVMNLEEEAASGGKSMGPDRIKPVNVLAKLHRTAATLMKEGETLWFSDIKPALARHDIRFVKYRELTDRQKSMANRWFDHEVFPLLTPQAVDSGRPMPMISGVSVNLAVEVEVDRRKLARAQSYGSEDDDEIVNRFARVKCPTELPRFLFMPPKPKKDEQLDPEARNGRILLLDDLIEGNLYKVFPGCRILSTGFFRITRNTEGEVMEADAEELLDAVRDFVVTRRFGSCVRLEFGYGMPSALQTFVKNSLGIRPSRIYRSKLPLRFEDFHQLSELDRPELQYPRAASRLIPGFGPADDPFAAIREKDRLLVHPYDSFENLLNLLRKAAVDPKVTAVKQTLYRSCPRSAVIGALLAAHRHGKQVTAVVELKARFNEAANISWAERLEEEGINVVYGFSDRKIHAKTTLIVREEEDGIRRYVHIGTGNYHGETAASYVDAGLFTADTAIADDVQDFFNALSGYGKVSAYRKLLVSPGILNPGILNLIEEEIRFHEADGKGRIVLKCNQLVDPEIIRALYRASQAGVKIDLIVRGICCLRPGVPGFSENINVRSVVGRFHEHARVYYFRHGGDKRVLIGSADLMSGNFTKRIEMLVPVEDPDISHALRHGLLKAQLADTVNAWELRTDGSSVRLKPAAGEAPVDSQHLLSERRKKGK